MGAVALFATAFGIGIVVSAPPGPVAVMTISRTLRLGFRAGIWSGLGIALGDAMLATIAAIGLALAPGADWAGHRWVALIAAPLLAGFGAVLLWRARRGVPPAPTESEPVGRATKLAHLGSTFLLAGTTPGTVPALVALFSAAGFAASAEFGWDAVAVVVAGVLVGAVGWWCAVCGLVVRVRERVWRWLPWVDGLNGVFLLAAAAYTAWLALPA